ncbi:MAG: MBL fold metallo-hydrolase [Acidobacteriota bacterium]
MTRRMLLQALPLPVLAQSYLSSPRRALTAPELKDAPDEWIERSFAWVDDMLARTPSWQLEATRLTPPETALHRAALIRLDDILHIDSAPAKPLVQQWYRRRMEQTSLNCARRTSRRRIVKLYDHGWFIETPSARFAIDLVGGAPRNAGFQMSPEARLRFADAADALFISHWHSDHADPEVARLFLARNKPVVAPADVFRDIPELQKQLTVLPRGSASAQSLLNLRVHVHPGHQGRDVINNCYRIESPGGFSVLHTGDQSNDDDFNWIDTLHSRHSVDLFLPNCWTPQPLRFVSGVKPRLTLPGHENEMAHTVPHREDWTQTFTRFEGCSSLVLPLCWGEEVTIA